MDRRRSLAAVIERHFSSFRKSQRKTLLAVCWGLVVGGRLGLASIARGMLDTTTVRHRIKRVDRFASNARISLKEVTPALASWILWATRGTLVVALDWTALSRRRVMLSAVVAVGSRAIPLAWTVTGQSQFNRKSKSRNDVEERLILRLKEVLGQAPWVLVADRGFARAELFRKLRDWGIRFVIRASGTPWVEMHGWAGRLSDAPRKPGWTSRWDQVLYHKMMRVEVSLVLTHKEPAPEPWYLVTNLERSSQAVKAYQRRGWIEEQFRDAKTHMGLRHLRIAKLKRLERLLILMAIVMALAVLSGLQWRARHPAEDPQLTTHKRGASLSVFLLGLALLRGALRPADLSPTPILASEAI